MAFLDDKIDSKKEQRSSAINQKLSIAQLLTDTEALTANNKSYFDAYRGLNELYFDEVVIENGGSYTPLDRAAMDLAVSPAGDGASGYYPDPSSGAMVADSLSLKYFVQVSPVNGGILQTILDAETARDAMVSNSGAGNDYQSAAGSETDWSDFAAFSAEKSSLESALTSLSAKLQEILDYSDSLIDGSLLASDTSITSFKSDIDSALSTSTGTTLSSSSTKTEIESWSSSVLDAVESDVSARLTYISTYSAYDITTGYMQRQRFWLEELIQGSIGSIASENGLSSMDSQADDAVTDAESKLTVLGVTDTDEWIPTPEAANLLQITDPANVTDVYFTWVGTIHATAYEIYRDAYADVSDNSQWSATELIATVTAIDPDTGYVETTYKDEALATGHYVYRVRAIDSTNTSKSLQSDVHNGSSVINDIEVL